MRLSDSVIDILQKYKYSNLPLEDTMQKLAETAGYYCIISTKREDLAHLLCDYKWNRISRLELSEAIDDLNCFQEITMW